MLDDKPDIPYSIEYDNADLSNHNSIKNSDTLEELDEEESELSDFNFREAIIYSEIINRKEY